ncbi:MAG: hypothetical protein OXE96_12980 [Gemmatimonadetes bacterium]|nr:hypothetical protein [Gemmatimonadota bacterium]
MTSPSPPCTPTPPRPATATALRGLCTLTLAFAFVAAAAASVSAQYRFGITVGGGSVTALVVEHRWAHQGIEVQLGTWGFRDLSVSVTAKQYAGSYSVEPFVGAGLWAVVARAEAGTGLGLIARFPVGVGWDMASRHNAALTVFLNRALAVKRPDPENLRPPRTNLIPLPELSYRWQPG